MELDLQPVEKMSPANAAKMKELYPESEKSPKKLDLKPVPKKLDLRPAGESKNLLQKATDVMEEGTDEAIKGAEGLETNVIGMVAPKYAAEARKRLGIEDKTPVADEIKKRGGALTTEDKKRLFAEGVQNSPVGKFSQAAYSGIMAPLSPLMQKGEQKAKEAGIGQGNIDLVKAAMSIEGVAGVGRAHESIVSPAIKDGGKIYKGANHEVIRKSMPEGSKKGADADTGFVTSKGRFVTRQEALKIAKQSKQWTGKSRAPGELHSEEFTRQPSPRVNQLAGKVAGGIDRLAQTKPVKAVLSKVAPAAVDARARRVAALKREKLGTAARDTEASNAELEKHVATFEKMTPEEDAQFARDYEQGKKQSNPAWQAAADALRRSAEMRGKKMKATPSLEDVKLFKDYLVRDYTGTPQQKQHFIDAISKQGSGKNLKARKYPTDAESRAAAAEAGLVPKYKNRARAQQAYNLNMDKYIAHNEAFDTLRGEGVVKYAIPGSKEARAMVEAGNRPLEGRLAYKEAAVIDKKTGKPMIIRHQAYAPEGMARVYNNYISKGFQGEGGDIYMAARKASNMALALKLGLSAFHPVLVSVAAIGTDVLKGARNIKAGKRLKGAAQIAGAPLAPARLAYKGIKTSRVYQRKIAENSQDAQVFKALEKANSWPASKRPAYMQASGQGSFYPSWKNGTLKAEFEADKTEQLSGIKGSAKSFVRNLGRATDTAMAPVFDTWIPAVKKGAAYEAMAQWIDQHPMATQEEKLTAARQIGDSMDNRFGEMNRDNLFWQKTFQQGAQLGFISYSWILGAARMMKNLPKGMLEHFQGKEMNEDAVYLIASAMTYAVLNATMQYMKTGKAPQSVTDLLAYQTGGKNTDQTAERGVVPGHWMQFIRYMTHPFQELAAEGNPAAKTLIDLFQNSDYRGLPIYNKYGTAPEWMTQIMGYMLQQGFQPITMQAIMQNEKQGSNISKPEQLLGVRPAPMMITNPERQESIERNVFGHQWQRKQESDRRDQMLRQGNKPRLDLQPVRP